MYSGQLLTVPEVAHVLRVDGATVRRWVKAGALEVIILPLRPEGSRHTYRINGATLDMLLQAQRLQPA
jgi:excisionase family DNA binding protein